LQFLDVCVFFIPGGAGLAHCDSSSHFFLSRWVLAKIECSRCLSSYMLHPRTVYSPFGGPTSATKPPRRISIQRGKPLPLMWTHPGGPQGKRTSFAYISRIGFQFAARTFLFRGLAGPSDWQRRPVIARGLGARTFCRHGNFSARFRFLGVRHREEPREVFVMVGFSGLS